MGKGKMGRDWEEKRSQTDTNDNLRKLKWMAFLFPMTRSTGTRENARAQSLERMTVTGKRD
jgi:hypothetical protein